MPVRMADVHLAYAPRLVHRRHGDLQTLLEATLVDDVDVVHPDRHPDALVIVVAPGGRERALPAPALTVQAEKNLAYARADGPEGRGSPHWKPFVQPSFSNQATLSAKFETFRIGVTALAVMACSGRFMIPASEGTGSRRT
jgi:hypothetical protein